MTVMACGGQFAIGGFHLDVQHAVMRATAGDGEGGVGSVVDGFHSRLLAQVRKPRLCLQALPNLAVC
jgi:hypothetical protein